MTTHTTQLKSLVFKGAQEKNIPLSDAVLDRINAELTAIENYNLAEYFLLCAKIVEICNSMKILRSAGRSTAPGSLVNYCLDITKIDPMAEDLIFEKLLHPETINKLNIDFDLPFGYQLKVVDAFKQKHPEYNLYFIALQSTKEAHQAEYLSIYNNNIEYKKHPCGICITREVLDESVFNYNGYDYYLANVLPPNDTVAYRINLLELSYLNRLQFIVDEIGEDHHPYLLPKNDTKTFDYFGSGELKNIFQFDSDHLKEVLHEFNIGSVNDLAILNALNSPNGKGFISQLIDHKNDADYSYDWSDERVTAILGESYGLLVFQETFLHLAHQIAGMSFIEAESWRKILMKPDSERQWNLFVGYFEKGCRKYSHLNEEDIVELTYLIKVCLYITFSKSHTLSYSLLAYWGAYYKTHFPAAFKIAFDKEITF